MFGGLGVSQQQLQQVIMQEVAAEVAAANGCAFSSPPPYIRRSMGGTVRRLLPPGKVCQWNSAIHSLVTPLPSLRPWLLSCSSWQPSLLAPPHIRQSVGGAGEVSLPPKSPLSVTAKSTTAAITCTLSLPLPD
jgi:hypothetical protein